MTPKHAKIWVNLAITCGILLGILLLIQSVATYLFVYDRIVSDEAAHEADLKQAALMRSVLSAKIVDPHDLTPLMDEIQRDAPKQVAWIRIFSLNSEVIASTGKPTTPLPAPHQIMEQLQQHQAHRKMIHAEAGDVLVVESRLRFLVRPPPDRQLADRQPGDRPPINQSKRLPPIEPGALGRHGPGYRDSPPLFSEFAIYVDGVAIDFSRLRRDLIIGCLAAVALLASMLSIGLLFRRYIRARQLEQQLELARSVQTDLLPSAEGGKRLEDIDFAAAFMPAAIVGGDFYDIYQSEQQERDQQQAEQVPPISIVLGDVAGKGLSAALLMGVLHGAIRSMRWTRSALDQEEASRWLNRFLCEKTARERFVSLFLAYFVPETATLRYVNAGHLPPLLIRSNAEGCVIERLESGGPVLGLLPLAQYASGTASIEPGDLLVVFSDGVAEAANSINEEFGDARIGAIAKQHIAAGPREICDAILREVAAFLGDMRPHDDQTLLVVRLVPAKLPVSEADLAQTVSVSS